MQQNGSLADGYLECETGSFPSFGSVPWKSSFMSRPASFEPTSCEEPIRVESMAKMSNFESPISKCPSWSTSSPAPSGETVILLHPPPPSVGVSIAMERERQQSDRLANGYRRPMPSSATMFGRAAGVCFGCCLRGPRRKCGTPVSGWQQQLVSQIGVPDRAPWPK